jgi:hypothetical protein
MVEEETTSQAAAGDAGGEKSPQDAAPLDSLMKAQIDQEVDAAFKDAPAKGAAAAGASTKAGPSDEAASDAEAHDILMQEVTDRAAEVSQDNPAGTAGETAPEVAKTAAAEASADQAAPPKEKAAAAPAGNEAMAAGRAAAAEATSAAEREGLLEKPAAPEKPKKKDRRAEAEAKAEEAKPGALSQMLAKILDLPGQGLATLLETIDKPFAWVGPEIRSIFAVLALVTLGASVLLVALRLARVI